MEENGFALDAYCVPKCGRDGPVPGGTMPKASNEAGSLFTEVKKNAKYPGPDYYKKEGKPFGQKAPLGQFSRIARDDPNAKKNWPAVGQYETITPLCTPRTRGGIMAKSTRGCLIYDQAVMEGKWKPAPGKYDPQKPEAHVDCLAISPDKEQSGKNNKKAVQLGPGYYSPNFGVMEKRQPAFQVPRQEARAAFISKDKAVVSKTEKNMGNSTPFHQSSTSTNVRPAQAGKMPSAQSVQWCAMVAVGFLASEALQRWRRQQSLAAVRREQIDFEEMLSQEAGPSEGAQSSAEAKPTSDEASKPEEKLFGLRTLLEALQVFELVTTETIEGPFQLNPGEQTPLVCFQFKMSHFVCKVYLAAGAEEGTRHLKLQTIFEDNRNSLIEEHRYFMANEWNSSKPYTRLQCGSRDRGQTNVFTLEYDLLCPVQLPHYSGVHLLASTLRMWYTSMMACVLHIVAPRDLPFATHTMIVENTLSVAVREEDGLQNEACPICLENFQVGDKVRRLPCMHLFHVVGGEASLQGRHCNIDRHLVLDKQCPICKTPIDIMEQVERDGAQRAQPAVSQPGESAQGGEQPATPAPVEETQAEVSRPAQSPAAESQEATQQTRQSEAGLPEQAAELERVVRSLQSRWLQIQDVVAGVQQMLHYIEDSQSALSAVRENAAAMTRTGDADPADPPAEQLEESQEAPENPDVPAETPATEVAMQRPEAPEAPEAEPESPATAAAEAVQAAATATTSDDRQVPMEAANWQPFTMAEKVCNAYTWRRRRLGMLKEMSAASSTTT